MKRRENNIIDLNYSVIKSRLKCASRVAKKEMAFIDDLMFCYEYCTVWYDSWNVRLLENTMSELVQVRKKAQVTLPQLVRQELGIEEGDFLDIHVRRGEIVLKVKKLVDKEQAWFWTNRWQQGEKEAEADILAGRIKDFRDAGEAAAFLHKQAKGNVSLSKEIVS